VKFPRPRQEEISVNLTPLIDVVFLLLMIYSKVVLYCKHHDRSWRYFQLARN